MESQNEHMDSFENTQAHVLRYVEEVCGVKPELGDSLAVIGVDSVAMAEMTFEFEKRFAFKFDDDLLDVETVGQLVQYVFERQQNASR